MELKQIYTQIITENSRSQENKHEVAHATHVLEGVNPTCGDEVTMRVNVSGEGEDQIVSSVTWDGQGCSISQASISVLTELVVGHKVSEATKVAEIFRDLMNTRGKGFPEDDESAEEKEDLLGDATAFTGVSQFPARIKCALLGWSALKDTFAQSGVLNDSASAK